MILLVVVIVIVVCHGMSYCPMMMYVLFLPCGVLTASGPGLALPGRTDANAAYTTPAREGGFRGVRGGACVVSCGATFVAGPSTDIGVEVGGRVYGTVGLAEGTATDCVDGGSAGVGVGLAMGGLVVELLVVTTDHPLVCGGRGGGGGGTIVDPVLGTGVTTPTLATATTGVTIPTLATMGGFPNG